MRVNLIVTLIALAMMPVAARASIIAFESFDYNNDQELTNRNGGSGNWKDPWSADSNLKIVDPGTLAYTDSQGNTLNTSGGHVRSTSNSTKTGTRVLDGTWGNSGTTVWLGVLIEGATGNRRTNVGLAEKFFVGQGSKTNSNDSWTLYDQDGQSFDSGIDAGGNTAFLAVQIDFSSGNEDAWLWINPDLNSTPSKSAAANGSGGSNIKEFEFDKAGLFFKGSSNGFIDELRVATTYDEISPFTAALNDTVITSSASLDFGNMLVGFDPAAQNADLSKTGLFATTFSNAVSNDGITVTTDGTIDAGNQTKSISVDFNTNANGSGTSGARNLSVTIDNTATTSAATGQGSDDTNDVIAVDAEVFQVGSPTANNGGSLGHGNSATITNAASTDGGQRASVFLDSFSVTGDGWSAGGLIAGTTATGMAAATSTSFSGTVSFNEAGRLNGSYGGTLSMLVENDPSLQGAANLDLNSGAPFDWQLSHTVSGNTGNLSSTFADGIDLGSPAVKYHGSSDAGGGTTATLLAGTLPAGSTIAMGGWRVGVPGEGDVSNLLSDAFNLSGTGGDIYVLQINYDDSLLGIHEAALAAGEQIYLAWMNNSSKWVNAVEGNSGGTPTMNLGAYNSATDFVLGNWGVDIDGNNVWAVLDHNGEFSVVPEPSTGLLAIFGLALLPLWRRNLRRCSS